MLWDKEKPDVISEGRKKFESGDIESELFYEKMEEEDPLYYKGPWHVCTYFTMKDRG